MKCPVCDTAELIHDTRDLPYTYKGKTTVISTVTAEFCPACGESITDIAEAERVMHEMQAFNKHESGFVLTTGYRWLLKPKRLFPLDKTLNQATSSSRAF